MVFKKFRSCRKAIMATACAEETHTALFRVAENGYSSSVVESIRAASRLGIVVPPELSLLEASAIRIAILQLCGYSISDCELSMF